MERIWPPRRESRPYLLGGALLLIVAGVALRVIALDEQGFWHDELYSLASLSGFDAYLLPGSDLKPVEPPQPAASWVQELRQDRYVEHLDRNLVHEGHPPLYYLGLKGWAELWGRSPGSLRSFSLLAALLTFPVLYLVGRKLGGRRVGVGAAVLLAVSPFHLYYSVEARSYAWSVLFVALALLAWVVLWQRSDLLPKKWVVLWWAAVLGAGYTHYYAGLYCAVLLGLFLGFRQRTPGTLLRLGAPFVLFVPWLPVLQAQLAAHSAEHWTVGAPSLLEATLGFGDAMLDQLTGVFDSATVGEELLAGLVVLIAIGLVIRGARRGSDRDTRWLLLSIPLYGLAVLGLDLITNHHTLLVSRYLISLLPCLMLLVAWLLTEQRALSPLLFSLFVLVSLAASYPTAMGERAPKQMLREAAGYIAERYEPGEVVLVTPSGPSLLGLARYLPAHALVGAIPPDRAVDTARRLADGGSTVWLARQKLGAAYELQQIDPPSVEADVVRFAGLDVLPIRPDSAR